MDLCLCGRTHKIHFIRVYHGAFRNVTLRDVTFDGGSNVLPAEVTLPFRVSLGYVVWRIWRFRPAQVLSSSRHSCSSH